MNHHQQVQLQLQQSYLFYCQMADHYTSRLNAAIANGKTYLVSFFKERIIYYTSIQQSILQTIKN